MSTLISLDEVRTQQPLYGSKLCQSELTKGLKFLASGANPRLDLISRSIASVTGTARSSAPNGKRSSVCDDYSSNLYWNLTPLVDMSNGMSIIFFTKASAEASLRRAFVIGDEAASAYTSTQLIFNANVAYSAQSGSVCVVSYSSDTISALGAASTIDDKWHVWVITKKHGERFYLYRDGVEFYTANAGWNGTFTFTSGVRLHGAPVSNTQGSIYPVALAGIWGRTLKLHEVKTLSDNPWQLFEPRSRQVFIAAAAATTHATSGVLANAGAAIAGTALNFTSHATTGVLASSGALIAGTASNFTIHSTSGALANAGANVVGTALNFTPHVTSGVLANTGATLAGTADHVAAGGEHATSGALSAGGAAIAGTAAHKALHGTSGVLANTGATLTGTASNFTIHATSGIIAATGATLSGAALHSFAVEHETSGALSGWGAEITGSALNGTVVEAQQFSGGYLAGSQTQKKPLKKRKKIYEIDPITGDKTAYSVLDEEIEGESGLSLGGADSTATIIIDVDLDENIRRQRYRILAAAALLTAH